MKENNKTKEDDEYEKELLRKIGIVGSIALITMTILGILLAPLINYQDEQAIVKIIEVKSLIPYQLTTFFMLFIVFFYRHVGKVVGKATYKYVNWDKKFPQAWDYDFLIFMIALAFITIIQLIINYEPFTYLFSSGYGDGELETTYLFPHNILLLLGMQAVLYCISLGVFYTSYVWELKNKTSDKKPWRCRDLYYELLGWNDKVIYWDSKEHYERLGKSANWKWKLSVALIFTFLVTMFVLELFDIYRI